VVHVGEHLPSKQGQIQTLVPSGKKKVEQLKLMGFFLMNRWQATVSLQAAVCQPLS
jgi:hypothetical protein